MKNVLLLTTGGTIASQPSENGLIPVHGDALIEMLKDLRSDFRFSHKNLMDLDSSNIQPEEWKKIATTVYDNLPEYDGIIITHGTDTMAYTASALAFMLQNVNKPVVMTGSQLPIDAPLTDGITNLHTAVETIANGIVGVTVAFDRKIINGTRAVKVSTMGFDAFESVNADYMARVYADGIRIFGRAPTPGHKTGPCILSDNISSDVFLLKLLPGTNPEIFEALLTLGYKGIILEAFGAGGLHYINRDLLAKLEKLRNAGVSTVVCSQCLYERCELSIYEVGRKMVDRGVISGRDMTTEAASVKLMWALGQTDSSEKIREIFETNYAGEVTL